MAASKIAAPTVELQSMFALPLSSIDQGSAGGVSGASWSCYILARAREPRTPRGSTTAQRSRPCSCAVAMAITRTSMLLLAMMMVPGAVGAHVGGPAAPAAAAEAMALAPDAAPAGAKRGGMSLSEQKAAKKKRQEEQMAAKRLARLAQTGGEASPSGGAANSSTAQEPEPPGPSPAAASPCSPCSSGSCPDGAAACPAACAGCQPDPFNLRPGAYVQGSYDPENRNNIKWTAEQLQRHVATVRKEIEKIGKTPERCADLVDGMLKDPKTTQYTAQVPSEIDKAIADSFAESLYQMRAAHEHKDLIGRLVNNAVLEATIAYLPEGINRSALARRLCVHRNTIYQAETRRAESAKTSSGVFVLDPLRALDKTGTGKTCETGVSLEGTTARTIGVCLERFSHKKRFGRQLLS